MCVHMCVSMYEYYICFKKNEILFPQQGTSNRSQFEKRTPEN